MIVVKFENEQNIIKIIQSGLLNYEKHLLNKCFIYIYYDNNVEKFSYIEVAFKKENFKHLCGISDKQEDLDEYRRAGISKEVIKPNVFFDLCKRKKLGKRHIIMKKDGTTMQKMHILNNLYKLTNSDTLYCEVNRNTHKMKFKNMIGLDGGNISLALFDIGRYMTPISSLDYDIKNASGEKYKIDFIARKNIGGKTYDEVLYTKLDVNDLPEEIKEKLNISLFQRNLVTI